CESIRVCDLTTHRIVTVNPGNFNNIRFSENTADCESIRVCRLDDQNIITITAIEFNNHQTAYSTNLAACQPVVKMALVTPTAPTQLPLTGASDNVVSLIGAGSLVASIGYYVSSRRALGRR
ncbi:LPXTG cell wall anchor domain-containing protein, partial [Candidatus Saccharibacteria bacterium]|nr:LPXTG cell wall anchor domain-containing protein [Candidatus Saccharibacteria bacterium]